MPDPASGPLILYRAFVPRWAYRPLSGDGAARFGGRWNPVGMPTIYAARELSTAWAEYNQGLVQHPALILQLRLHEARLADLTLAETIRQAGLSPDIHDCEWRHAVERGVEPATHAARRTLIGAGYDGVVYPSFMSRGGTCVALWCWGETGPPRLSAVDPEGRLPATPASWVDV